MSNQDVNAYYNQTQNHYQRWWQLSHAMALHYGLWYNDTHDFLESLNNTNRYLAKVANVQEGQKILDAGCGVGGSSIYLAKSYKAQVTGITLSELQVKTAIQNAENHKVSQLTNFKNLDFCKTYLKENSFDIIWACESSSSAPDKQKMANEWYRLLKPGGKLVLCDFFKAQENQIDKHQLLEKWTTSWAMSSLLTVAYVQRCLKGTGFELKQTSNLTNNIFKSARRMYMSYWLGLVPSELYNRIFGATYYARNHYKSGLWQYTALKKGLWQYNCILAIKPT